LFFLIFEKIKPATQIKKGLSAGLLLFHIIMEIKYGGERNTNIVSEHSPPFLLTVICMKVKTIIKLNVLTDREKYDTMETLYKKECCYGNLLS
jgi:hypothetical protein